MDFENPNDLIGKLVLYEAGQSYSYHRHRDIATISKVTKTCFRIDLLPEYLFNFYDGSRKGLNSRSTMFTISKCTLLTNVIIGMIIQKFNI